MSSNYLLSICMIVKDEEKNLPRCLDSLKPLLDEGNTELIIVDTGSSDNTVEIARRYTKSVYMHLWNDNFSDMRNISISYAQGEWIFIIDADEELENPKELLSLLNNGQLKDYCTVQFKEKNLLSIKQWNYVFHVTERMFRNDGSFKYTGSIHNQPMYKKPVLKSDIWLIHYGYINEDKQLMEKKFRRTGEMLKKELKKNPDHVYYRFQLARTFFMYKDVQAALHEIRKAYFILKKKFTDRLLACSYVYGEYSQISYVAKKYEEAIRICKEGIKIKPEYIDLYYILGYSCFCLEREEEGLKSFEEYFELCKKYYNNQLNISQDNTVELYSVDKKVMASTAHKVILHLLNNEKYEDALNYIDIIEDDEIKTDLLIKIYIKLKQFENIFYCYDKLTNQKKKDDFIRLLEREKESLDGETRILLEKAFASGEDVYSLLNKIIIANNPVNMLKNFVSHYDFNKLSPIPYYQVLAALYQNKLPLITALKSIENNKLRIYVKTLLDKCDDIKNYLFQYLNEEIIRENDYQSNRVFISIASVILLEAVEKANKNNVEIDREIIEIFVKYVERGKNYISNLFQVEKLRLVYKTLDNIEVKFFILMYLADDAAARGNEKVALRHYKEAAEVYPYMAKLLSGYTGSILKGGEAANA